METEIKNYDNVGILDPKGINKNPLTGEDYSDNYKKLGQIWSKFPAYGTAKQIIKDIENNQVILVVSGTGSGKTVLFPKYMLHAFKYKGKIAITLPKQIVTKSSAEFASATLDVKLGEQVGYKYKGSPRDSYGTETNLLYATDGTIVQRLLNDPELKDFDAVIIDEAHERKVQIDFLLFLLKRTLKLRPEFKLVIMSATINTIIFANYFSEFKFKQLELSGETNYPIESIYLDEPIDRNDYLEKGLEIVVKLLSGHGTTSVSLDDFSIQGNKLSINKKEKINDDNKDNKDILFFITSSNEASDFCKKLSSFTLPIAKPMCVEVYSGMPAKKEILAIDKDAFKELGYKTKVAVSTNVAESSLTIDGIKYVIDGGYEYLGSYDPQMRGRRLDIVRTTKAQVKQRMGRAGRTGPGVCYHLYTKEEYEQFRDFPEPDIRTGDISSELLSLLHIDSVRTVEKLLNILSEMIEPPKKEFVKIGLLELSKLGLIEDQKITQKGDIISKIAVSDIYTANCLFYSYFYKCSREMSLIIGLLDASGNNMKKIFDVPNINRSKDKKMSRSKPKSMARSRRRSKSKSKSKSKSESKFKSNSKSKSKSKSGFGQGHGLMQKFKDKKNVFKHESGDHLSFLKIMDKYTEKLMEFENADDKIRQWCFENFLKYRTLQKAKKYSYKIKRDLVRTMSRNNIEPNIEKLEELDKDNIKCDSYCDDIENRIIICLILGLRTKKAKLDKRTKTYNTKYVDDVDISRDSFLKSDKPSHIVFTELFIQKKNKELNIITKIPEKFIK